jgi:hypothetical protein
LVISQLTLALTLFLRTSFLSAGLMFPLTPFLYFRGVRIFRSL